MIDGHFTWMYLVSLLLMVIGSAAAGRFGLSGKRFLLVLVCLHLSGVFFGLYTATYFTLKAVK